MGNAHFRFRGLLLGDRKAPPQEICRNKSFFASSFRKTCPLSTLFGREFLPANFSRGSARHFPLSFGITPQRIFQHKMAKGSSKKQKQVLALKKLHKEHLATLRKALIDGTGKDRDVTKDPDVQPMMCRLPALAQPQHHCLARQR
jgi:hypothetical protein